MAATLRPLSRYQARPDSPSVNSRRPTGSQPLGLFAQQASHSLHEMRMPSHPEDILGNARRNVQALPERAPPGASPSPHPRPRAQRAAVSVVPAAALGEGARTDVPSARRKVDADRARHPRPLRPAKRALPLVQRRAVAVVDGSTPCEAFRRPARPLEASQSRKLRPRELCGEHRSQLDVAARLEKVFAPDAPRDMMLT